MPDKLLPQHINEIASAPRSAWLGLPDHERISTHIARSEGFAESAATGWGRGVYSLFDEMEDKDPHLFSVLQTRKNGVLARPRKVEPASSSESDREIALWLTKTLEALPSWDAALLHLLDSLGKGMAVLEVIWGYDSGGRVVPVQLKPRNAGRFNFGPAPLSPSRARGNLFLNDFPWTGAARYERGGQEGDTNRPRRKWRSTVDASGRNGGSSGFSSGSASLGDDTSPSSDSEASLLGRRLPDRKFMVMLFNPNDERIYGRGLCERVYWYWWFKKINLKFWVLYNEKFGAPTVVARHDPGLSPVERERLMDVISSLQTDAGIMLPDGISLDLLESNRRGSAETYRELATWCNEEISRAVLGQTLTVGEGSGGGSLALAKVHEAVRFDYIRTDACMLTDTINSQLIRWIVEFNFGQGFQSPRWSIDLSPEIDRQIEVGIDRQLLQMGVPLPLRYFYQKYGRPAAAEGERQLRYDDSNLFQYHLQFGVLTVNEVRSSLGLPPVSWGDKPTSPAAARSDLPAPGGSAGDGPLGEEGIEKRDEARQGGVLGI